LNLNNNPLTSFDGGDMSQLTQTQMYLYGTLIETFIGVNMSSLTYLNFSNWQITTLTSFDGGNMSSLTDLSINDNQLTSFNGAGLTNLIVLSLDNNQLTSFDGTGLSSLASLGLASNSLTLFDATSLSSLSYLDLVGNPMTTSVNNQILQQLNQHGVNNGYFGSNNGRTSASNADYDNLLIRLTWSFGGLDLTIVGNGKLAVRGVRPTP
jgi:hypothetical protein